MSTLQNSKRKQKDIMKLMSSKYDVILREDNQDEFTVIFAGPKGSEYIGVKNKKTNREHGKLEFTFQNNIHLNLLLLDFAIKFSIQI